MKNNRWHTEHIEFNNETEKTPLTIVSDAGVSTGAVADGRLLPVLLVDCSLRKDIENMIKIHADVPPGDVKSIWGKFSKKSSAIMLILSFEKPSKCKAVLELDILRQGGTVDQIMRCEAFVLQCGSEGERFISTLEREKLIIEVPSRHVWTLWNEEIYNALFNDGKRQGLTKQKAKEYAGGVIKEWRSFTDLRNPH